MPLVGIAKMAAESAPLEHKKRVSYLELPARSFLGECSGTRKPFDWTVNPYRGCEYGCRYCYARYTHAFLELPAGEFETKIFAKRWDARQFRRETARLRQGEILAFGTATDCYQPAERRYGLMRRMLEALDGLTVELRIGITTKSDLIRRDAALLGRLARRHDVRVNMTITTLDPALARRLEPFAPRPALRLAAMRRLAAEGVALGVGISPVLPRITDAPGALEAVAEAARDAGARSVWAQALFLRDGAREIFLPWVEREFPALGSRYRSWYHSEAYLTGAYPAELRDRVERIRDRLGMRSRDGERRPPDWTGSPQLRLFA